MNAITDTVAINKWCYDQWFYNIHFDDIIFVIPTISCLLSKIEDLIIPALRIWTLNIIVIHQSRLINNTAIPFHRDVDVHKIGTSLYFVVNLSFYFSFSKSSQFWTKTLLTIDFKTDDYISVVVHCLLNPRDEIRELCHDWRIPWRCTSACPQASMVS